MADSEFSIKFSAETGEFSREMEKLRGQLEGIVSKPGDIDTFISKLTELRDQFAEVIAKYTELEQESEQNTRALREQLDALDPNAKGYEQRKAAIEAQIQVSQRHTEELHANVDALTAQRDALAQTAAQSGKSARAFFETTQETAKADAALKEYGERLPDITGKHQKLNAEMKKFLGSQKDAVKAHKATAKATDVETRYNELLALSRRELVAEMRRIGQERKMAATRGETEEVARLTKEYGMARQALRTLNQQKSLTKMMYLQQAQAAASLVNGVQNLSQSFANLGKSAKEGTLDLTGMAQSVISLSFAMKAGLGPLGAIVAAVEVATKVWNAYASRQREVRAATMAAYEAFRKLDDARLDAAMQRRKQLLDDEQEATKRAVDAAKRQSDIVINENQRALDALRQQNEQAYSQREAEQRAEEQNLARTGTALQLEEMRRRHALELQQMKADAADAERVLQQATANEQKESADKALSEQKRLSDGMRKGYKQLLDIGFTEKDRKTIDHYFRQIDSLAEQRNVTQAQIESNKKKIDKFLKENEDVVYSFGREIRAAAGAEDSVETGKYIAKQKKKQKRLENEVVASLEAERQLNQEIEQLYPDILREVGKLKQAEGLSAAGKFRLYLEITKQVEEAEKQTEAAEEAAKSAAATVENLEAADDAAKKLAEQEEKNAKRAAETALANARLDEGQKKILKATKTTGSYSERDTRTQYDILRSDKAILETRLVALQNELEVARASGADAEKIKSLTEDITALKKSIRGAGQQIDNAVPELVKSLREGIKPGELVALNPANQAEVDRVAAAMSGYGKELEELYRKLADAEKNRSTSTTAENNVEKYREKIAKLYKKMAADAEGIDARVVGGTGGTELFKQIDTAAQATVDSLNAATRKQQASNAAGYEERQQAAQKAITAELERRAALLAQQNNAMEAVLTKGQQGGSADALGRVLGASERMLQYIQSQQKTLEAAQSRISRIESKLKELGPKVKNLIR